MSTGRERQRILIVGQEPLARDDMRILLGSAGCECTVASSVEQTLATIGQKKFDAVVLDPQSSISQAADMISRINEFHPNLLKHVVIIADEDSDSEIKDLAERRSEEHTSELQSRLHLVCRLLLEKKKSTSTSHTSPTARVISAPGSAAATCRSITSWKSSAGSGSTPMTPSSPSSSFARSTLRCAH